MTDLILSKVEIVTLHGEQCEGPQLIRLIGTDQFKRVTAYSNPAGTDDMYLLFEVFGLDDTKRAAIIAHPDLFLVDRDDTETMSIWLGNRGYNKTKARNFRGQMVTAEEWVPRLIEEVEQLLPEA